MNNTYTRLRTGDWGIRVSGQAKPGQSVDVTTRAGEVKRELIEAVVERLHHELVLDLPVRFEHGVEQVREHAHLGKRAQLWRGALDVVEQVVEDDVLSEQGFGDFHRGKTGAERKAIKSEPRAVFFTGLTQRLTQIGRAHV